MTWGIQKKQTGHVLIIVESDMYMGLYYIISLLSMYLKIPLMNFYKATCVSFSVSFPLHVTFHFSFVFFLVIDFF